MSSGCSFPWGTSRPGGTWGTGHPKRGRRTWLSLWGSSSSWLPVAAAAWERPETTEPGHPWLPAFPHSPRKRPPSQTGCGQSSGEREEGLAVERAESRGPAEAICAVAAGGEEGGCRHGCPLAGRPGGCTPAGCRAPAEERGRAAIFSPVPKRRCQQFPPASPRTKLRFGREKAPPSSQSLL